MIIDTMSIDERNTPIEQNRFICIGYISFIAFMLYDESMIMEAGKNEELCN